ncbi:DUF2314 domain-containing protein [Lysobacter sp. F60174L2]|uniref:DUF2314 domain-containing protein n=1 Tax=Lysobacter sp. F60174L2 TaxID=3459295 RepID=UPI00403E2E8D
MRLLAIAVLSLLSMVPALSVTHGLLGLDDDVSGVIALVAAFLVTPSLLLYLWRAKPGFDALPVDPSDVVMREQVERARREIGRLLDGLDKGVMEAFVKFPLPVEDTIEHVWGMAHSHDNGAVIVSLASTPVAGLSEDMLGRRPVPAADIEDWMLRDASGKTYGGYTNLALARIYRREYGKLPRGIRKEFALFVDFSVDA